MAILKWLEGIRVPALDKILGALTYLGDVTAFLVICVVTLWCVNKRYGYFLMATGICGALIGQFMKILCRVPRPWVQDETFTIVESARAAATGYSLPSGHSINAVATFGGIALVTKKRWVRIASIALAALICFSRLYLGVHTPQDVGLGILISVVILAVLYPIMVKRDDSAIRGVFIAMTAMSLGYLIFMLAGDFTSADPENLHEALKNAYLLLGSSLGLLIAHEIDIRYLKYDTKAVWWAQIIKAVLGLAILLGLRVGLKAAFSVFGESEWIDAPRYFLMVLFAGCVWPMTFKFFSRLGADAGRG